jgi:hypothetical protein
MKKILTDISLIVACFMLVIQVGCQAQKKPVEAAKPAEVTKPVEVAKPAEVAKPLEAVKPVEVAKPVEVVTKPAAAPASETVTGGPAITFEANTHDFGEVGPGTRHSFVYKFKNTGDATLKITEVKSPCSCTIPALDKKEYAPGESGEINVTYTAVPTTLPVTKQVWVVSNDKKKPEFELIFRAITVPKVKVQPENFQLSLRAENAGMTDLTLTSSDGQPFSIRSVSSPGGAITAAFDPNAKATSFVLKPRVDVEKLRANLSGAVTIELTHPSCATVMTNYTTKADYETQPAIFYMQKAKVGRTESKELWVISNYDQSFEIESITSEKGSMKAAAQEKMGNKYRLTVEITPPAPAQAVRFFLDNLIIKIKNGPTLKVRCNVWLEQDVAPTGTSPK